MADINQKTAITLVCLSLVLFAANIPLYLGKIGKNHAYGFRFGKAFQSDEHWYAINRYGAKVMMCWSFVIMGIGVGCLYLDPQQVLFVAKVAFLSLLVPVGLTMYYARRL